LMGQGFGATEVYGGGFEGVEDRDAGLDGEQVMVDVVAVGEGGGFCGGFGHVQSPGKWSRHFIAVKRSG